MAVSVHPPGLPLAVHLFRVTTISGMACCVAAAVVLFVQFSVPAWDGGYLVLLTALLTFETLLSESTVRQRGVPRPDRLRVLAAEFGIVLFLLKPASYLGRGWDALLADLPNWILHPDSFVDLEFVLGAFFLLLVWAAALDIARGLYKLSDYEDPIAQSEGIADIQTDFVSGAYLLLLLLGLRHVAATVLKLALEPLQSSLQLALPIVYFALGLLVLGQARYALLRARWEREEVPVDARLGTRWAQWGLALVAGVALAAFLMPAGDTITGFYVLVWLEYILSFVAVVLIGIFAVLLALIFAPCLGLAQISQQAPSPPTFRLPPPPPAAPAPDWLSQLRLVVFWLVVAAVLYILIRIYWQDREGALRGKRWSGLWTWLRGLWGSLLQWRRRVAAFRFARPAPAPKAAASPAAGSWWQRWRARTARERVQRLYFALLERAARSGFPRSPDQTPYEYAARLEPQIPLEGESLDALTGAFVRARYSRSDFTAADVGVLHRLWQRLRAALQAARISGRSSR